MMHSTLLYLGAVAVAVTTLATLAPTVQAAPYDPSLSNYGGLGDWAFSANTPSGRKVYLCLETEASDLTDYPTRDYRWILSSTKTDACRIINNGPYTEKGDGTYQGVIGHHVVKGNYFFSNSLNNDFGAVFSDYVNTILNVQVPKKKFAGTIFGWSDPPHFRVPEGAMWNWKYTAVAGQNTAGAAKPLVVNLQEDGDNYSRYINVVDTEGPVIANLTTGTSQGNATWWSIESFIPPSQ